MVAPGLAALRRYRDGLDERCEHREFTEAVPVGAFRFALADEPIAHPAAGT